MVWAICDHLYTVHIARLRPFKNRHGINAYPKVDRADMEQIFARIRGALSHVVLPPSPAGNTGSH